jgi:hypothetical protein
LNKAPTRWVVVSPSVAGHGQACRQVLVLTDCELLRSPVSALRNGGTSKSLRHLAGELFRQGHRVTALTVGKLLKESGFSLQGTARRCGRGTAGGRADPSDRAPLRSDGRLGTRDQPAARVARLDLPRHGGRVRPLPRSALVLVAGFCTPTEVRAAGHDGLTAHLREHGAWRKGIEAMATIALRAAAEQTVALPGEAAALLVKQLARKLLNLDR